MKILVKNIIPSSPFSALFKKYANYKYRIPKVSKHKNIFVSHEGIALKNFFLHPGTAFNIRGFRDINFYLTFWKTVLIQFLTCKYGKSLPSKHYTNGNYTFIHSKWFNYGFWLNSSLHRLIKLEEQGLLNNTTLLIPETIYNKSFVKETLSIFDVKIELIPLGTHMFIDDLIMVDTREYSTEFYQYDLEIIRKRLSEAAEIKASKFSPPSKKVYLSRKPDRNIRLVSNSTELENYLIPKGYKKVYFEDYSIWGQIKLMSYCESFIAIHGAGCANIIFMSPNSQFTELINREYATTEYKFPFWKLSSQLNIKYSPVFCEVEHNKDQLSLLKFGNQKGSKKETDYLVNKNLHVPILELSHLNH